LVIAGRSIDLDDEVSTTLPPVDRLAGAPIDDDVVDARQVFQLS
jgi:hypothetical protein